MSAPLLSVEGVSVARGGVRVLEGVSFGLLSGAALVLRGPNGIGKTTLLRTIAGLQPVLDGEVRTGPESLVYAGHADGIKPTLTVEENLWFWASVFGCSEISGALKAFQLEPLASRPAGQLSAGQKRRLGLSRLLVTGRPVWLLDEPTVSLDKDAVAMFVGAVEGHLQAGGAALLATHIELGLSGAGVLELAPFKATTPMADDFDEAFL